MVSFKDKLKVDYPIPWQFSIWSGNNLEIAPLEDWDKLIETCTEELASDLFVTDYMDSYGMVTQMPEDCVNCTSAMLTGAYPFQGNRIVKLTYDRASKKCFLRYFPATITFLRKLTVERLELLQGDRLRFAKAYMLWKMAEKELNYLKPTSMNVDNGQIDLTALETFKNNMNQLYTELKDVIFIYSAVN